MSDRDIFGNLRYDFVSPYIRFDKKKKIDGSKEKEYYISHMYMNDNI